MTPAQSQHRFAVVIAFALVYFFWGSTYLGIDIAVEHIPPALMCGIRFLIAGVFGLVMLPPMYFLEDYLGRQVPPPITHLEIYYGFVGVTLAWQIGYLVIATDPARYRPFMLLGALGKGSFAISTAILVALGRAPLGRLGTRTH